MGAGITGQNSRPKMRTLGGRSGAAWELRDGSWMVSPQQVRRWRPLAVTAVQHTRLQLSHGHLGAPGVSSLPRTPEAGNVTSAPPRWNHYQWGTRSFHPGPPCEAGARGRAGVVSGAAVGDSDNDDVPRVPWCRHGCIVGLLWGLLCCHCHSCAVLSVSVTAGPSGAAGLSSLVCRCIRCPAPRYLTMSGRGFRCTSKFCATLSSHNLEGHH